MTRPTYLRTQLKAKARGFLLCLITFPVACNVKTSATQPQDQGAENRAKAVKEQQTVDEEAQRQQEKIQQQATDAEAQGGQPWNKKSFSSRLCRKSFRASRRSTVWS
jgi:hypothetical protein